MILFYSRVRHEKTRLLTPLEPDILLVGVSVQEGREQVDSDDIELSVYGCLVLLQPTLGYFVCR